MPKDKKPIWHSAFFWILVVVIAAPALLPLLPKGELPVWTYEVVRDYPHQSDSFTQGFLIHDGDLYESTGARDQPSRLMCNDLETGEPKREAAIQGAPFAEGIAIHGKRLYMLTWKQRRAMVYDLETFEFVENKVLKGEGWGLTSNGTHLIQSDGTETLVFRDPESFEVIRRLRAFDDQARPLTELNELEWVQGEIWANQWHSDRIARIDPATGRLNGWVDLTGIYNWRAGGDEDACLNGIAYEEASNRIFVTGKLWPKVFEIKVKAK